MAVADTAKLIVDLSLKGNFARQMGANERALDKFTKSEGRAFRAGAQIGTGIRNAAVIGAAGLGILALNVQQGLDSLIELEQQTAQTNAVLKSTGGVAGVTADEVGRLAEKYESLNATVGDEVIREGENLLLTFTNIRKEAFEPALAAALDMNTALGKGPDGLTATIKTLGKALNDPTKGLGVLSKAGVTFSDAQVKVIKALQEEGDLFGAQSIILGELNKRYEGSFLTQGQTTAGKVAAFTDAVDDLQRTLATALLPVVGNVATALQDLLQDPEIIHGAEVLGQELGKLFSAENVKEGARVVGDVVRAIADAAPTIGKGLSTAASVIGKVLAAFQKLPPEVQQLAIGAIAVNKLTGGLITNVAGAIFGALKVMTVQAGVVNVSGAVTGSAGGLGGGAAAGGAAGIGLGAAVGLGALVAGFQVAVTEATNKTFGTQLKAAGMYDLPGLLHNLSEVVKLGDEVLNRKSDIQIAAQSRQAQEALLAQRQTERGIDRTKTTLAQKAAETTRETTRGATQTQATQRSTAGSIQATIRANRPIITTIVNVSATTVTKKTIINSRYGPPGGSRDTDSGGKQAPS